MALLPCARAQPGPPRFTCSSSVKSQFHPSPFLTFSPSISLQSIPIVAQQRNRQPFVVRAAWTRRSKQEALKRPNKKSWKQRTDMFMRPFMLNVFFSKRFIHAKLVHRGTSKVISSASTNAKDLRNTLKSLIDEQACRIVGKLIAERAMDADVYAMAFEVKKDVRVEGKLGIVLDAIKECGIIFVD
ncbi:hypothetical protein LUZ60_016923 [Juncus effusus]|nr:hypothetical protein LUZ60_016923 [Juncus effusus]